MYAVCDRVVDGYEAVAAALEIDVDEVEASVFSAERTDDSARIYVLKREIAEVRRAVLPLREPMRRFATGAVPGRRRRDAAPFFRDVADHLARVVGVDRLASTCCCPPRSRPTWRGSRSSRTRTCARSPPGSALVAVPTLIAGVYGMNFDHMPELQLGAGLPDGASVLMVVSSSALWIFFKRSGWL